MMRDLTKVIKEIAQQNQQLLQRIISREERETREGLRGKNPALLGRKNEEWVGEIESHQSKRHHNEEHLHQSHIEGGGSGNSLVDERLKEVQNQLKDIMRMMKGKEPSTIEDLVKRTKLPFLVWVMNCPLPHKFHALQMEVFKWMRDPLNHLETYKILMHLQALLDEIMCQTSL